MCRPASIHGFLGEQPHQKEFLNELYHLNFIMKKY